MRTIDALLAACLFTPGLAHAVDCSAALSQAPRPTSYVPVSSELATSGNRFGSAEGVLTQAFDESQSVDHVLFRIRTESCQSVAMTTPTPGVINPNDPAAYKPRTEFDNTPWRFDMTQNGKQMTADEFSAWMKTRGVRVARGANAPPVPAPAEPAPWTPSDAPAPQVTPTTEPDTPQNP